MYNVNITAATKKIADAAEMYVDKDFHITETDEFNDTTIDCITIGEENSDFLIQYGFNDDGSLYLLTHHSYVQDLPETIKTSIELKNTVKYAVVCCHEAGM